MNTLDDKTKKRLFQAGAVVALYFWAKRQDDQNKKDMADAALADNPAAAQAAAIKTMLRPYGYMWMRWITIGGVDYAGIMRTAEQITDLNAVVREYQKFVGDGEPSMHDDLELCIGAEGHQKFLALATKGKTGTWYYAKESTNVPVNHWVITKADTNVRRTPQLINRLSFNGNIVKTVVKGKILGATTGKFAYDEPNKVLFIEFKTIVAKTGKWQTYFAAKSQVELVSNADKLAKEKKEGKINLEVIEGIGGIDQQQEVVTTRSAIIFNEKFERVGTAPVNTIIGFPLMTLDTGRGKHIQIKTVQGLLRWVRADQAQIRERRF